MTAKEKAFDIFRKYMDLGVDDEEKTARECSLICVNEILNDNPNIYDSDRLNHKYWKEVKREIGLL